MTRKMVLVLVLVAVAAGGAFAQSGGLKAALALDLAPTLTGFIAGQDTDAYKLTYIALSPVFEYGVGNYSIGVRADFVFGSYKVKGGTEKSITHVGMAAIGRWYPLAKLQKLYVGTELGFDTCSWEDGIDPLYTGLTFALRTGWKHLMGRAFLEPSLGYVKSKSHDNMPLTPSGWEAGLNIGVAF
jgi:hypothetical protein